MTITTTPPAGKVYMVQEGSIARIYICNPRRYNAMSLSMWRELLEAIRVVEEDDVIRVVVLTGADEKAFVSGADISEFATVRNSPQQVDQYAETVKETQHALSTCSKIVIAGIRGVCVGGGIGLALACDLRYCSASAMFRMPAARLGLGYDLDGMRRMVEILGTSQTADLFFSARKFDGYAAERVGLVNESFDDTQYDEMLNNIVSDIASNAPLTLRAAKLTLRHLSGAFDAPTGTVVADAVRACFESHDYLEGQDAFLNKRQPNFKGV